MAPKRPTIRPCLDLAAEVKTRWPFYASDWRDGFTDKKVLASSIFIFFANIAPAITFAFYLDDATDSTIGVVEVLLSSSISGFIYSIFSGQPLIIIGVTGPTSIFTATILTVSNSLNVSFLPFYSWTILWSALMHIVLALGGACTLVQIVTRFSCEIFGAMIAVVYLLNGGREVVRGFKEGTYETGITSLVFALGTLWLAINLTRARHRRLGRAWIRGLIADYAIPIAVIFSTVFSTVISRVNQADMQRLNVPSEQPFLTTTSGRGWLVDLGALPVWAVFAAFISGAILTTLFYFDHNVSSLLSQRPENHLKKPSAYNYDFLILGLTLIPCGLLGIPPCNGLIPQAPLHVRSLAKIKHRPSPYHAGRTVEVWERVSEQRISNLMQSLLTFVALIPGVLHIIGKVPRAVLAGLFFAMGFESFFGNQFAQRFALFFADPKHAKEIFPHLSAVSWASCTKLTLVQIVSLAATLAVTESDSPAALCFPVIIAALVPVRYHLLEKFIPGHDLEILDADDGREIDPNSRSSDSTNSVPEVESDMNPMSGMEGYGAGGGFHPPPFDADGMIQEIVINDKDVNDSQEGEHR